MVLIAVIALVALLAWISLSVVVALGVGRVFARQSSVVVSGPLTQVAASELHYRHRAA